MSAIAQEKALRFVLGDANGDLGYEGGWVNAAGDKGGETFRGCSRVKHPLLNIWPIVDAMKVRPDFPACANQDPTLYELVREFFVAEFWEKVCGDQLPEKMAVAAFDCGINSGPEKALKLMQIALGVVPDGVVGAKTVKAAFDGGERAVVRFLAQRAKFLHRVMDEDPTQEIWAMNWFTRLFCLANVVLEGQHVNFDEPVPGGSNG